MTASSGRISIIYAIVHTTNWGKSIFLLKLISVPKYKNISINSKKYKHKLRCFVFYNYWNCNASVLTLIWKDRSLCVKSQWISGQVTSNAKSLFANLLRTYRLMVIVGLCVKQHSGSRMHRAALENNTFIQRGHHCTFSVRQKYTYQTESRNNLCTWYKLQVKVILAVMK